MSWRRRGVEKNSKKVQTGNPEQKLEKGQFRSVLSDAKATFVPSEDGKVEKRKSRNRFLEKLKTGNPEARLAISGDSWPFEGPRWVIGTGDRVGSKIFLKKCNLATLGLLWPFWEVPGN